MFTHPPLIDNNDSGETLDLPGVEAIDVIGAGFIGVGLPTRWRSPRCSHRWMSICTGRKSGRGFSSYKN
jgi:hypothetical protein